jgi:deoxyribodipyrimidine photo-lyase
LAFRDFYAAVLHQWPASAWRNWNAAFDDIDVDTGADAVTAFEAWKQGRTGFPIVDAGMRQLLATGFMHNRVRMIVASFLVKDLHLPWQWGARWFMEQLVDADVASNQHGWQWCAGTGTDAAPYFRVFNPTAQGEKFDPAGDYVRRWVSELADPEIKGADVHRLKAGRPPGYPEPIVDHAAERNEALRRYGLLR